MNKTHSLATSHTKVILPKRRQEILTRPRLLEMMLAFLDKKLVLVSAPAGYGKTSLLVDLSQNSDLAFCWLALDELDRDPQRFFAYFVESITHRFPDFGSRTRSALNNLTSLDHGMEQLVITLVNEIYDRIPQHFVIVLDDYHLIGDVPAIQRFLSRLAQLVDENFHLVISSRVLINLIDIPLMVARDQVGGLDLTELAFRADEIQSLFSKNYGIHLSDKRARELEQDTEGWITGLQLSQLGIENGMVDKFRVARAAGVDLFDYLSQQVLDQQPEDLQFFLLRSSLLEEFDVGLCESVLGSLYPARVHWREWTDAIIQKNLFALPVGLESGWVRYHHLFRDFLQDRLKKQHPKEIKPILKALGHEYESRQDWERAYHIQKQLKDVEAMAGLIERAAPHLLQKAMLTLESWLADLPPSMLRKRPGVLSIRGNIEYMKGNLIDGLDLLNKAEEIFRREEDALGLATTLIRRATVYRYLGNYQAAVKDADEVIAMSEYKDDLQLLYADALRQRGLSLFRQGRSRQSVKVLEQALKIYLRLEDNSHIPVLMMETGMAYVEIGKAEKARLLYDEALEIWRQEGNLNFQANLLNNLGVLHYLQGDYEKSVLALEEGLLCARRSAYYVRMESLLLTSLGDVYAEVDDFELAKSCYQQGKEIADEIGDKFLTNYLLLAFLNLSIKQQEFTQARQLLEVAQTAYISHASQYEDGLFELLHGQLLLHEDQITQAKEAFANAERHFSEDGRIVEQTRTQIWMAAVDVLDKDIASARQNINKLLEDELRDQHTLVVSLHTARVWLESLVSDTRVRRPLHELFDRLSQFESKLPAIRRKLRRLARTVEVPTAKFRIHALGRTSVKVGGKALGLSDWQSQSVRDLFFYFLSASKPQTKEQIGVVFWPDIEDPNKLKLRFKNDLYRLRRAVGGETIIFEDDRYHFNRTVDYEYDVEAFESYLSQANLVKEDDLKVELLEKAVALVRGQYLQDIDASWVEIERGRLNQAYLSAQLKLADLLRNTNRIQDAIVACQRAIEYDPTHEAAYEKALKIYGQLRDRSGIVRLYESYTEAMALELDLPPSMEMETLYSHLIR
jgi:LuxR family transcriptional regulator, maltose regulon positive regulatory protein